MKDEQKTQKEEGFILHPSSFILFLIGYRGTGKTEVGRRLAERLGRPFVDMDAQIVERCGSSIRSLVDRWGWEYFRAAEKEQLKEICTGSGRVVSTGGGVVLDPENITEMKNNGKVVWLKASVETMRERMAGDRTTDDQRPSLTPKGTADEIETVLAERDPLYRTAMDFFVETDLLSIEAVCDVVLFKLGLIDNCSVLSANAGIR